MLTNRILPRLALAAALLTAGATLPAVAQAHDGDRGQQWRHHHDNDRRDYHRHWEHRRWEERHWHGPQVYERRYIEPRAYYAPAPVLLPRPGVTFIYRDRW